MRFAVLFSQEETILDVIKEININSQILVCFYFCGDLFSYPPSPLFRIKFNSCFLHQATPTTHCFKLQQEQFSNFRPKQVLPHFFLTLNLFVSKVKYPPFFKKNHLTLKFLARTFFLTGNEYRIEIHLIP